MDAHLTYNLPQNNQYTCYIITPILNYLHLQIIGVVPAYLFLETFMTHGISCPMVCYEEHNVRGLAVFI